MTPKQHTLVLKGEEFERALRNDEHLSEAIVGRWIVTALLFLLRRA